MAQKAMFVDVARNHWFIVMSVIGSMFLIAALLVGVLGPSTYEYDVQSAYDCPNGSHNWDPLECKGRQLGNPNSPPFRYSLERLETLNGFWSLVVFPFNKNDSSVVDSIDVTISMYARNDRSDEWIKKIDEETRTETLLCDNGDSICWGFVILYEDVIKYNYYQVDVYFPDDDNDAKQWIGDVDFEFVYYNVSFIEEELMIRVTFLVIATIAIFFFWFKMRFVDFEDWTFEQKCVGILLLSLIFLNNPFYPMEFLVAGSFFPIVDALFQVLHSSIQMFFWLIVFDHIRQGSRGTIPLFSGSFKKMQWDILKPIVIFVFFILTFTFFVWFRVSQQVDPLFGDAGAVGGLVVLFFLCALLFGSLMVWILVLMMLTVPVVLAKRELLPRFLFVAIPTAVCLISIIGGLFFGSFGPVRRTATSFCYFYTLNNIYVLLLTIGYWPMSNSGFASEVSQPSEATPIFQTFQKVTRVEDSDEDVDFAGEEDGVYGGDSAL